MNIVKAIISLRPNAEWVLRGEDYTGLDWMDINQIKPTEAEINSEIARLQAEYNAKEYQRKRAAEYPPMAEQLDKIFHNGIDEWKKEIQAVKDKYPKGE